MGVVLELRKDLSNNNITTLDIVRKAYIISRSMNNEAISEWLESEIDGYDKEEETPEYRRMRGIVEAYNPYHGWHPMILETDVKEIVSNHIFVEPLSEIEGFLSATEGGALEFRGGGLDIIANEIGTSVKLSISKAKVKGVLEKIRDKILKWTLDLESEGILGENMTFN